MYQEGVYGWKIIECKPKPHLYNLEKREIYLITFTKNKKVSIVLTFSNEKLFWEVEDAIYKRTFHPLNSPRPLEPQGIEGCLIFKM